MTATEAMERTAGNETKDIKSESNTKPKDHHAPSTDDQQQHNQHNHHTTHHQTPKKRRKVSHACLYCRRSHMTCDLARPCTRCVKRNIGHLCHDEPRDQGSNKSKSVVAPSTTHGSASQSDLGRGNMNQTAADALRLASFDGSLSSGTGSAASAAFDAAAALGQSNQLQLVQPTAVSGLQGSTLGSSMNQFGGFPDSWLASQSHYHDMHNYHPSFVVPHEVSSEFDVLNNYLRANIFEDPVAAPDGQNQGRPIPGFPSSSSMPPPATAPGASLPTANSEQSAAVSKDKTREYYLQAADPSGNADADDRMLQVLTAKVEAGLLQPFNYIKGYQSLQTYLNEHVSPGSRQKILRQLDRFRPKFREKMQGRDHMFLTINEMQIESSLMEYDRVFASMAVPACCWRRTGEIFRGNKEMAELIDVPVEDLRNGKTKLHEILTEESVVRYWEEFGTIAFDPLHDTLLTACTLKSPNKSSKKVVNCCFSFRIKKDNAQVPGLIIGNFIPHDP
ncbi:Transcription factor [Podospora pseudopauciseta]|uniref:Transcription factor n=2 Tax=Podospora TaxID=5144 RepID=A0ABR0HGV9_9PEZI|nr:Transcription factor [Podospora pseudopauciseta]KAK4678297.1 Transcription factor [Podospora pseudoanserina]